MKSNNYIYQNQNYPCSTPGYVGNPPTYIQKNSSIQTQKNQQSQILNPHTQMQKQPFLLEFKQLKEYFNFLIKFNQLLSQEHHDNKMIHNEYYLIDRNWVNEWKNHVGYNEIKIQIQNREINDNDYNFVKSIIQKYTNENSLSPLSNENIYYEGEINPMSDFIIINKKSHQLFSLSTKSKKPYEKDKSYPVRFFKEKLILYYNDLTWIIIFKEQEKQKYYEFLLHFKSPNFKKSEIKKKVEEMDINQYIKNKNINIKSQI